MLSAIYQRAKPKDDLSNSLSGSADLLILNISNGKSTASTSPKELEVTFDHQAQLFFSLKSIKGLKIDEPVRIYCLASLEKQTIQTTSINVHPNSNIEWNEGYTFDVSSPNTELTLTLWQTNVNSIQQSNDQEMSVSPISPSPLIGNGDQSLTPRKSVNMFNIGKVIGRVSIPYSVFQTQYLDQWFPVSSSCSIHVKLSYTNSNNKVTLNDFAVLSMIGKGGFGHVNVVKKVDTGRLYAMKIVKKDRCLDLNAVQHTFTERKLLKKYYHPFIVGLKYSFQTQDSLCMVLDYIGGGELFYHINERETFSEDTARFYISQIMLAIGFLHEHGVIYRDLKLENLLMDLDGNLCLVDFGLCKEGVKDGVPTYTMCGSPEYMAPETINGSGYGKSVDWWALGTLFYEMIVGLPPFYCDDPREMTKLILTAPLKFPPGISKNATSLVSMLLNRDPQKRLGSGESDVEEIKTHPFFRSVNWQKVLNKEVDPPFKPHLNGPLDFSYFDPGCTISKPVYPNSINTNLSETDQMAFQGFSYSAPDFFNLQNGSVGGAVPSSPSISRSGSMSQNTPLNNASNSNRLLSNSPVPMTLSQSPMFSPNSSLNSSNNSTSSGIMSPPAATKTSWVQPQFPHLHQPIPQKPIFALQKLQERRRSASVNSQTQFSFAFDDDDEDEMN
ncbi:putative protein serine/threonine kinase [Cavenderia fasciculata]|uniref:non-specific serine/threonine protein kinase n=1 Tax=Cavenderia fasciculata TaxID=261658 RepID=F4PSV2_CACFS|nr:putative protein serine/threonine kinase [Cavenderia fasciculata]EGG21580.1 putative protein serine/threonine kinase [Cavenderia fasciculata]|eukprot:XP_004359430.1 putative protein serine/threonine kinase [Cavenderia fasciculata]